MSAPSHTHNGPCSPETQANFRKLLEPHVVGFNYFATAGIQNAFKDILSQDVQIQTREMSLVKEKRGKAPSVEFWFERPVMTKPSMRQGDR